VASQTATLLATHEHAHHHVHALEAPVIGLHDIRYVRLGTRDLAGATRYADRILGLRETTRRGNSKHGEQVYFRSDDRDHTLVYFDGDPMNHTVGFEVADEAALDAAAAALESAGRAVQEGSASECDERRVRALIRFNDPTGNCIELVAGPAHSGVRFFPTRDTGTTGFSHVGLRTTDPVRDERFWTQVLGARVSDRIGQAPLLRIDEVHHKIALFPSTFAGVQHINHQVESVDDIMRSWYFLKEQNVKIVFGPGRHPTSGAMFLYFEGPDGLVYEYSSGVRMIDDPDYQPRQFPFGPDSFCMWGSRPDIPEFSSR
jgi:2,3-dihydroxy-p-cumate/2,3-dihydroxybenzoate 3,4-dioxygenase